MGKDFVYVVFKSQGEIGEGREKKRPFNWSGSLDWSDWFEYSQVMESGVRLWTIGEGREIDRLIGLIGKLKNRSQERGGL